MTRNILNHWDLEAFLKGIEFSSRHKPIRDWIDSTARRWILKNYRAVGRVLNLKREAETGSATYSIAWRREADSSGVTQRRGAAPDWVESALTSGVYWLDLGGRQGRLLESQLYAIVLFFQSLEGSPRYTRLDRIAFQDAVAEAQRFREMVQNPKRDNTLMVFENGFRFALLTSDRELAREGQRMNHCVGDYGYELEHGSDIVSLRDSRDRPHVTIEVQGGRRIVQIKGKANGPVRPRYSRFVALLIRELGLEVAEDRENAGLTDRPLDVANPDGWAALPGLRDELQLEIDGRIDSDAGCLPNFFGDVRTGLSTASEDTWAWFLGLFRAADGRFVRLAPVAAYDVGGERFATLQVRFPDRLYETLEQVEGRRARIVRRQLRAELENLLLGFGRRDSQSLLALWSFQAPVGLDLRRLRHEHQQRVARRLATTRRDLRRRAFAGPSPYAALACWESAHRGFIRHLQLERPAYL